MKVSHIILILKEDSKLELCPNTPIPYTKCPPYLIISSCINLFKMVGGESAVLPAAAAFGSEEDVASTAADEAYTFSRSRSNQPDCGEG